MVVEDIEQNRGRLGSAAKNGGLIDGRGTQRIFGAVQPDEQDCRVEVAFITSQFSPTDRERVLISPRGARQPGIV